MSKFIRSEISPSVLFILTMLTLPALVFQDNAATAAVTVLFFTVLNYMKTGKVKLLPSVLVIVFITIFTVLEPMGKVLFRIGDFPVTETALLIGLRKGLVLTGMVMISKFAVSRGLSVPGSAGKLVGEMLSFFDMITAERIKFTPGKITESIDRRFMEIYSSEGFTSKKSETRTTGRGFAFMGFVLLFSWGLFLIF